MVYTDMDALYDILVWQLPVPCVLGACFACQLVVFEQAQMGVVTYMSFLCFFAFFWTVVAVILLVLDLLVLPPVFAFLRLSHSKDSLAT
jgi:hypothetical protein